MDNRDVVARYIAEMRALLLVIQRHLEALGRADDAAAPGQRARGTARVAMALADLSARFNVEDCAQLAQAMAQTFATDDEAVISPPPAPAVLAAATDIVTFIAERIEAMADPPRLLRPSEADRVATIRLLSSLVAARPPRILPADVSADGAGATEDDATLPAHPASPSLHLRAASQADREESGELSEDELALTRSFSSRPLRQTHAPAPTPIATPLAGAAEHGPDMGATDGSLPMAAVDARLAWQSASAAELDNIPQEMRRLFIVETADDLQDLRALLLKYEERQADPTALLAMGRIAHKIKGAAATLGFDVLASLAFTFGDLLTALHTRQVAPGPDADSLLVRAMALMQSALDAADAEVSPDPALPARMQSLRDEFFANGDARMPTALQASAPVESGPLGDVGDPMRSSPRHESESFLRVDVRRLDELMSHASALAVNRAALTQIREDVDRFQAEMASALARLADLGVLIGEVAPQVGEASGQTVGTLAAGRRSDSGAPAGQPGARLEGALGSGPHGNARERERQTEFEHAMRVLTEVVADLGTTGRSLRTEMTRLRRLGHEQAELLNHVQRDVMQIRLVPLSTLVPRLQLEVRRLAPLVGKQVSFSVRGELTEIDRNISEQLTDPLIQLVRNATVHGIEPPGERQAQGKPAIGSIWLHAYYVGSEVIIEVGDDGMGVNPHVLIGSAIAAGVLDADTARALSLQEALDLIFLPGVTSFQSAQMVSGRGVGLDEVRTVVQGLKGSIHVRSERGQGLVFRIRVPISLSIVRALRVAAGGQHFAVPFSAVQRTVSLAATNLVTVPPTTDGTPGRVEQRVRIERDLSELVPGEFEYDELPLFALGELLGFADNEQRQLDLGLVVDAGQQRVALRVESVLADQEMVVQALPPHLRRRALRGASVTPDGQVLLLLDLPELVSSVLEGALIRAPRVPRRAPSTAPLMAPRVLVVDDSISVRRTLEQTFSRAGFMVQVAQDGIEALDLMLVNPPQVAVLDIEMPRLDGFELLTIMRGAEQLADVQVVMLTSRSSEQHRAQALNLGARAYLVKPCPEDMLVETVRSLSHETAGRS